MFPALWPRRADLLGCGTVLPTPLQCGCGKQAVIYPTPTGYAQLYCSYCNASDDLPAVIIDRLGISTEEAVGKHAVKAYLTWKHKTERFTAVWDTVRLRQPNHSKTDAYLRGLNLSVIDKLGTTWAALAGSLVGCVTAGELAELFSRRNDSSPRRTGVLQRLTFKPTDELVVVPYYDAPGRLSSLCCFNVTTRLTKFIRVQETSSQLYGLGLLSNAYTAITDSELWLTVFICDDPIVAACLHTGGRRFARAAPPVVSVGPADEYKLIRILPGRKYCAIGMARTPRLIQAAAAFNADVTIVTDLDVRRFAVGPVAKKLVDIRNRGAHWEVALSTAVKRLNRNDRVRYLREAQLPHETIYRLVNSGLSSVRGSLNKLIRAEKNMPRAFGYAGHSLVLTKGGIWSVTEHAYVSNTFVTITGVYKIGSNMLYVGRVEKESQSIQFERVSSEHVGNVSWMTGLLAEHNVMPPVATSYWLEQLWPIAIQLTTATVVCCDPALGWDRRGRRFNFPGFFLQKGGVVSKVPVIHRMPFLPPGAIDSSVFSPDMPRNMCDLFWSVTVAIMTFLVGRVLGREAPVVSFESDKIGDMCNQLLGSYNCQPVDIKDMWLARDLSKVWPAVVTTLDNWQPVAAPDLRGHFVELSKLASLMMHINEGWLPVVYKGAPSVYPADFLQKITQVIPNYLHWFFQNNCKLLPLATNRPSLLVQVLDDMSDWVVSCGGKPIGNYRSSLVHRRPSRLWMYQCSDAAKCRSFRELLRLLGVSAKVNDRHAYILGSSIEKAAAVARLPRLNYLTITKMMSGCGYLISTRQRSDTEDLIVSKQWWDTDTSRPVRTRFGKKNEDRNRDLQHRSYDGDPGRS